MLCSQVMCDGQLALLPVSLLVGALGGGSASATGPGVWPWESLLPFVLLSGAALSPSHVLSPLRALNLRPGGRK